MMAANDPILTVAQMRAAEQALIDGGETVDSLMLAAGLGAARWIWRMASGGPVTVLCGPGNNGGDGYVIAESLRSRGSAVRVIAPLEPATEAARNARATYRGGVVTSAKECAGAVFVDCLFGSGLTRPLSPELEALVRQLAGSHRRAVAVDLPSGVGADDAALLNAVPRYDLTIALGAWKPAHWRLPARAHCGALRLVDIGIGAVEGWAEAVGKPKLAAPGATDHKYTRGLCGVVGGAMPGAALLACRAAMRGGAGYVKLFAEAVLASAPAELVVDSRALAEALAGKRPDCLLVGPGLGRGDAARARLETVLEAGIAMVLDADALHLLRPGDLSKASDVIATPHAGELAVLCHAFGIESGDQAAMARDLARASGMVVLAKGPDSMVAGPDGRLAIAPPATSWLSVAGTGDVLAGLVASRRATGLAGFDAACQALWLHGEAARLTPVPFLAGELADHIPAAIRACL